MVVADLISLGAPSTWLDDSDDVKEQPGDAADATRPDIWKYEGARFLASGVGPSNEAGFTISTGYDPDWGFVGIVFSDIGNVPLSGSVPGDGWDMTRGRFVVRYYIDASVKAEASYLLPVTIYSSNTRNGLFASTTAISVGFFDSDGVNFAIDTFAGSRSGSDFDASAPFPWAEILDKWVEFDVRWACETPGASDGFVTVRMRTSTDGSTWTDLAGTSDAVVLDTQNQPVGNAASTHHVGDVTYGMSVALGFAGLPGKVYYAVLYDSDTEESLPLDYTDPCCDDSAGGAGGGGVTEPPDDVVIIPTWTPAGCDSNGGIPASASPTPGEQWL